MNETITTNLERKSILIDEAFQLHEEGFPLPAWVEVSPVEACNRRCVFCPKSDQYNYPNQPLEMQRWLYSRVADELDDLRYQGTVVLSGYGEPMLHKHLPDMVSRFAAAARVELVTDGDMLTTDKAAVLVEAGLSLVLVSLYDGPEQVAHFQRLFAAAGVPADRYVLRERWQGIGQDFGVKLTNRAGVVEAGNQPAVPDCLCYYPAYSMMVDWNGDVMLCAQDWNRRVKAGNLYCQALVKVWDSPTFRKYRVGLALGLAHGRKGLTPCAGCNAAGVLHGARHAEAWRRYYARGAA
jgi:MoaA/NifB/PqqE/SkfB family radical SAM enzyme